MATLDPISKELPSLFPFLLLFPGQIHHMTPLLALKPACCLWQIVDKINQSRR